MTPSAQVPVVLSRGVRSRLNVAGVGDGGASAVTAGFVSRLLAFVIDIFAMSLLAVVAVQALTLTSEFFRLEAIAALRGWVTLASRLIVLAVVATYLPLSWILTSRSPGKAIMGLRIVSLRKGELTIAQSLVRFVSYWLSALPLGLGFWWSILDPQRRTLHDVLARTRVVYDR